MKYDTIFLAVSHNEDEDEDEQFINSRHADQISGYISVLGEYHELLAAAAYSPALASQTAFKQTAWTKKLVLLNGSGRTEIVTRMRCRHALLVQLRLETMLAECILRIIALY